MTTARPGSHEDCIAFLKWYLPRVGLHWPGYSRVHRLVCKRLNRRMAELGMTQFAQYRPWLAEHPDELARIDAMCRIPISRFYRDRVVFQAIGATVLPAAAEEATRSGAGSVRCWSAGCASGEEPFTMLLVWHFQVARDWPQLGLQLLATDADEVAISRARAACYAPSSLKDVSVFPLAPDPQTGRRQIEQLAFEVVSTESIGRAGIKAGQLVARGVRRVFAVDVERSRALEWSAALGTWSVLDPDGHIEDPALGAPLPIGDLVHAAKADDSMARALIAKRNPVIEAVRAQDRAEGKAKGLAEGKAKGLAEGKAKGLAEGQAKGLAEGQAKGKAEALVDVLALRNLSVDDAARSRILGEQDLARLQRWLSRAMTCATVAELFAEP